MKIIIDGGLDENNNLLLTNKYITGFKFVLTMTKDNVIIAINNKNNLKFFNNLTFSEIIKKWKNIYMLTDLLEKIGNYQKNIFFELINQKKKNKIFIDLIIVEIQKYNNISFSFETKAKLVYALLKSNNYPRYLITNNSKKALKIKRKDAEIYFKKISSPSKIHTFLNNNSTSFSNYLITIGKVKDNITSSLSLLHPLEG